ncbi:MAG: Nif3-like dinuclear metal center hexameric protein [Deltaproteobacteria bacterium]|nr:Nif3-like dinuclear metal center hexameric protein [Deltaproteobacteria bacterium]
MSSRSEIISFLDDLLKPQTYRDYCPNGLQVFGCDQIERVATCTSVSEEFFELAAKEKAQLLLVHHGLFWDGSSRVVDPLLGKRLRILLEKELNLVAYHIPLDAHQKLGNNARLAALLELGQLNFDFGHYKGTPIGCVGNLEIELSLGQIADRLSSKVGGQPQLFDLGPQAVKRVGIVSGGAGDIPLILEAMQSGCDAYITGVMYEQSVAIAREAKVNVVALGHYNSEKLGVEALGDVLAKHFGLQVVHLDVPNPV